MNPSSFEKTIDDKKVRLFKLENPNGLIAYVSNYGARLISLKVLDKEFQLIDVVAGFNTLEDYLQSTDPYHGATLGRFCSRIANAKFALGNNSYIVCANEPPNSLHGGKNGFHSVVWDAFQVNERIVELRYVSVDKEQGYPGNVITNVTYTLTDDNSLKITYLATTDKPTIINLTNHAYFNLNGDGNILNHKIQIKADKYLPINEYQIPLGKICSVDNSPFDFRKGFTVGSRIDDHHLQLRFGNGYNHNFILRKLSLKTAVASVIGDKSGIMMEVFTDQPGLQLYTGNHFSGENKMRSGRQDLFRSYLALETQHFPDSPNQLNFPSTILRPGQVFNSFTLYKFS